MKKLRDHENDILHAAGISAEDKVTALIALRRIKAIREAGYAKGEYPLLRLFTWKNTLEGYGFWNNISDRVEASK